MLVKSGPEQLSKLPHPKKTWLGFGHTFEHNDEFANGIGFNSVILLHSMELSKEFTTIKKGNIIINIFTVAPLYKEELEFKKEFGTNKLLELFDKYKVKEIVKIGRINTCK